jgi:phytoene desaturase
MGGLTAALRLARRGIRVRVFEGSLEPGGLASSFEIEGLRFDAGPYILLDREGLEWSFAQLGLDLARSITLKRIEQVYEVASAQNPPVRIYSDLNRTAEGLERSWPGSGARYRRFIESTAKIQQRLRPMLFVSPPGSGTLLRSGAWMHANFLLRSLGSVLRETGLPQPVIEALAIWTHVAAQTLDKAPSPLAFVPALIHTVGAYYPLEGIGAIPHALASAAVAAGVEFHYGVSIANIQTDRGRVRAVRTGNGEEFPADAVVSNHSGIGTYLDLVQTPESIRERLRRLPLQSPGVCAYLAVRNRSANSSETDSEEMYLRFMLPSDRGKNIEGKTTGPAPSRQFESETCRLLVSPGVLVPDLKREAWWPARLIAPMPYSLAERGQEAQQEFLERVLAEEWWQGHVGDHRILATRTPREWSARHHLYRESMNPVMTSEFMRAGRMAHRSPVVEGLYLAGSSTHPGQWVSFCAISGVLAADKLCEDFA